MHDLANISVAELAESVRAVQSIGRNAANMEECASGIVRYLYESLIDKRSGTPANCLVRFFKTHDFGDLSPDLKVAAREALGDGYESAGMKCLVLLGTAGELPEWDSRHKSVGHRAIPLPSRRVVERMPMISQLVKQLGVDVAQILSPDPALIMDMEERATGVFYIPDAQGNPYIPAQHQFVMPYGVRSVVGIGGVLPSGNLFSVVLFTKVKLSRERAEMFRILAVSVKAAVVRFDWGPIFHPTPAESA